MGDGIADMDGGFYVLLLIAVLVLSIFSAFILTYGSLIVMAVVERLVKLWKNSFRS